MCSKYILDEKISLIIIAIIGAMGGVVLLIGLCKLNFKIMIFI